MVERDVTTCVRMRRELDAFRNALSSAVHSPAWDATPEEAADA